MKRIFALAVLVSHTMIALAQQEGKAPYLTQQFDKQAFKEVLVSTSGGYINVYGSDESQARVEVYIRGNNGNDNLSKEEIAARLADKYELKVGIEGGKLVATARTKEKIRDWKKALSISFRVYAPKSISTDLTTSGGSISLSDLEGGKQDFHTSGGSLTVKRVNGKIKGRTSGGSIHVEESGGNLDLVTSGGSIDAKLCKGDIELATSGGSITLNQLKGTIEATTSGGSIRADEIKGDLTATTSGGSIRMDKLACNLNAGTSGGQIDVAFTSLEKFVKLHNSGGSINLEIPKGQGLDLDLSGNKVKVGKLENFSGKVEDDDINGKVNGGGTLIYAHSRSGRVSLDMK